MLVQEKWDFSTREKDKDTHSSVPDMMLASICVLVHPMPPLIVWGQVSLFLFNRKEN